MFLSANLRGIAGLTDVGYRFYDKTETPVSARSQAGVIAGGDGWYSVEVDIPVGAQWIRWDSILVPKAKAREDLAASALNPEQAGQLALMAERAALITSGTLVVTTPVTQHGKLITLVRGSDYLVRDGTALLFDLPVGPDLTGATARLRIGPPGSVLEFAGTVTAPRAVTVELTKTQTLSLTAHDETPHELTVTLGNTDVLPTLVQGKTRINDPV